MARRRVLSHDQARAFYDRFGRKQDLQRFYEDPAIEPLLAHADFERARAVVEFGCGTGRLAARLLRERLPGKASYLGFDVSETMVRLAGDRVEPWGERATVRQTDGTPGLPVAEDSADRFLCTYVLDLLGEDDIHALLREARRVLEPGGALCLLGLTFGRTLVSRALCGMWRAAHAVSPRLVGGCRPVRLLDFVRDDWEVAHTEVVCTLGLCSEVVVAR